MKETLITNIISNLVNKIGVENSNVVRDVLVLEMKDIELKEKENQLIVYQDEITDIVKKFLAIKKLNGCTDRTLKAYFSELEMFFRTARKNPKDITTDDVRLYLAVCRKTCSNATLDNKRRYLNSFFDWCNEEDIITKNPVKRIDKIKSAKKVKESFTDFEIEKMRNVLMNSKAITYNDEYAELRRLRNIAIFETLLSTGMRVAELVGITRNQINENTTEIIILGKGNKERIVYLNARANIAINNYLSQREDDLDWLFIGYKLDVCKRKFSFSKLDISSVELIIRKLGEKIGIKAHPHKFRRTAATNAVGKGMPIEQVQKMLGHSSLNTTQIYVNVQDAAVKNSHEKYFN